MCSIIFWTVVCDGEARSYYEGGEIRDTAYKTGDTKHFSFPPGDYMLHNLENTGAAPLRFVTVEFKTGKNAPLDIKGKRGTAKLRN
jgi:beta-alanine degradation protein BauB